MLEIRLLGGFSLWREQVPVPIKTQALRELLSYLILNNKPIRRETVAEDLWGEQTTGDACKKYVNSCGCCVRCYPSINCPNFNCPRMKTMTLCISRLAKMLKLMCFRYAKPSDCSLQEYRLV